MLLLLLACTGADDKKTQPALSGIGALGHESHDLGGVAFEQMASSSDGLDVPRDLEFNPEVAGELWIVNRADDSVTILFDAGTDAQTSTHIVDPYAEHFMEEVSSLSFGKPGHFGTCQESRNTYNDKQRPNDFMGPTLWSSDLAIFGESNPAAVDYVSALFGFYADLGSHLDMLHESPLCMGIAWETENVYWVFDGMNSSLSRYDFAEDHGAGYDDHSDGVIGRYVEGEVERVEDVPSHMVFDHDTALLYVADTGNNRVAVLDTATGTQGDKIRASEPGVKQFAWDDAEIWTFIEGSEVGWGRPSGLALFDGVLYVGDNATGNLVAYDVQTGEMIDWIPTGLGGLMGIEVVSEDEIWLTDAASDAVYRLTTL